MSGLEYWRLPVDREEPDRLLFPGADFGLEETGGRETDPERTLEDDWRLGTVGTGCLVALRLPDGDGGTAILIPFEDAPDSTGCVRERPCLAPER